MSGGSDGFSGDVELGVVSIAVEMEAMVVYDVTDGGACRE